MNIQITVVAAPATERIADANGEAGSEIPREKGISQARRSIIMIAILSTERADSSVVQRPFCGGEIGAF